MSTISLNSPNHYHVALRLFMVDSNRLFFELKFWMGYFFVYFHEHDVSFRQNLFVLFFIRD
jgi:hypothetical protein